MEGYQLLITAYDITLEKLLLSSFSEGIISKYKNFLTITIHKIFETNSCFHVK